MSRIAIALLAASGLVIAATIALLRSIPPNWQGIEWERMASDARQADCAVLEDQVLGAINSAQTCQFDAECISILRPYLPFGCYIDLNRNHLDTVNEALSRHKNAGCVAVDVTCGDRGAHINACVQGKCTITEIGARLL